jgi:dTDP-4-dehydrorhamnose reductase
MRIAIIGATGQLGSDLVKVLGTVHHLIPMTHEDIEVTDCASVFALIGQSQPDVVINTAAFHRVDQCEDDVGKALSVNARGVRNVALACREAGATLVHLSTDYVFGGDLARSTPYAEDDLPAPTNMYGVSKLAGEHVIRYLTERYFIFRVAGLFGVAGSSGKGGNFVELMLRLASEGRSVRVVDDQRTTPTYTVDLARQIAAVIETDEYGLYHATSQGDCTWYEFAAEVFRQSGLEPPLARARTGDFGEKATRPAYSVLGNAALQRLGKDIMRPWQEALAAYLQERAVSE